MLPLILRSKGARHQLQVSGSELFAPHANVAEVTPWRNVIADDGVKLIGTVAEPSIYSTFGTIRADTTIECTLSQLDADVDPLAHAGIILRWQDASNFAVGVMIKPSNGHFQVVDKIGGGETIYYDHAVTGGLSYNTRYKIIVELKVMLAACSLYDLNGSLLDTYLLTVQEGTPATGYNAAHIYGATAIFHSLRAWDGLGADLINSNMVFASVYPAEHRSGLLVASSQADFYSDGTNGSANTWMKFLTNIKKTNFFMTGTFIYKSGRVCGVAFRNGADGQTGYELFYDTNGASSAVKFYKDNLITLITSTAAPAMVADTEYPWSLIVSGTTYTWVINGHTYSFTDASYPTKGYIGLLGHKSHYLLKDWITVGG